MFFYVASRSRSQILNWLGGTSIQRGIAPACQVPIDSWMSTSPQRAARFFQSRSTLFAEPPLLNVEPTFPRSRDTPELLDEPVSAVRGKSAWRYYCILHTKVYCSSENQTGTNSGLQFTTKYSMANVLYHMPTLYLICT